MATADPLESFKTANTLKGSQNEKRYYQKYNSSNRCYYNF